MSRAKATLVTIASLFALSSIGYGIHAAVHSRLFLVRVVEIADQPEGAPVDAHTLTLLAAIPLGAVNLFELDLLAIEKRVLAQPWIREVRIQKRLPQTVALEVTFREPQALITTEGGGLAYVDRGGRIFGHVWLGHSVDLPVLMGIPAQPTARIETALKLLELWSASPLSGIGQISTLTYDKERGYRALVTYPLPRGVGRTLISLGHDFDAELEDQLGRLRSVLRYLADNGIPARQIWADTGKKIIVKIDRRS